jgi:hypothetical protein
MFPAKIALSEVSGNDKSITTESQRVIKVDIGGARRDHSSTVSAIASVRMREPTGLRWRTR